MLKKILAVSMAATTIISGMSVPAMAAESNQTMVTSQEITDVSYIPEIGMTDEKALELYETYTTTHSSDMTDALNERTLEEFADYAVDNGVIDDTPVQRAAITKAIVRAEFKTFATAGSAVGYKTAAKLLDHSLQDNPSDYSFSSSSSEASQIKNASEFKSILSNFKKSVKGKELTSKRMSGSVAFTDDTDLYLAYHNMDYSIYGKKSGNTWTLTVTLTDTYDFDAQAWKNKMSRNPAVTVINNYAAYAQSIGAIVPYDITVKVIAKVTE